MPTKHRARIRAANVPARPDAPVARLQIATAAPTMTQRFTRPASELRIGAAIMYETRKAVASEPVLAMAAISSSLAEAADAAAVVAWGKNWARISGSTAARM